MADFEYRRLNNRTVDALEVERETLFWDRHLPGFAVRVYPSGTRTYVVQTRGPYGARRVTLGRHGAITATEARRRAWQAIARIKAGKEPLPEHSSSRRAVGPRLADMAARYMDEYVAVHCKPATMRIRSSAIYKHIVPRLGHLRIGAVRRRHVTALQQRMAATPVQANNVVITLSQIYTKAQDWGIVVEGTNPCRHVELYRQRKRERFLTEVGIQSASDACWTRPSEKWWGNAGSHRGDSPVDPDRVPARRNPRAALGRRGSAGPGTASCGTPRPGPRVVPLSPSAVQAVDRIAALRGRAGG